MKLCLAPELATAACLTRSSPSSSPIPLGAEVIQKECRALVQQTIEGKKETEERKESNPEIKDCFFFVVKNFLFCFFLGTMK